MLILITEKSSNLIKKTIKEDGTFILEGVFVEFDTYKSHSGRIYPEEVFQRQLEELKHKMIMESRFNKINKLNERIKNRN
jgi:hypothetical protein